LKFSSFWAYSHGGNVNLKKVFTLAPAIVTVHVTNRLVLYIVKSKIKRLGFSTPVYRY
jgi:hypothetical protein